MDPNYMEYFHSAIWLRKSKHRDTINAGNALAAVMKLKQRYEDLEMKLEEILFKHKALTVRQTDLNKEMHVSMSFM